MYGDLYLMYSTDFVAAVENNRDTRNYQKMLAWLGKLLEETGSVTTSHGLSNYVYIQRMFLGMLRKEKPEGMKISKDLLEMTAENNRKDRSSMIDQVADSILHSLLVLLDRERRSIHETLLLMELMKFIITICVPKTDEFSDVFLQSFMSSLHIKECATALLRFWTVQQHVPLPKSWIYDDREYDEGSYAISSMAKSVLSMVRLRSSTKDPSLPMEDDNPFATLSSLVLFSFYFYGDTKSSNAFRSSLDVMRNDDDVLSDGTSRRKGSVPFGKIAAALGKRIATSEAASLLLYVLLQGNKYFFDYLMVRELNTRLDCTY